MDMGVMPKRMQSAQGNFQGADNEDQASLRITPVFYHKRADCVKDADNTAMRVMGVLAFANIHQG